MSEDRENLGTQIQKKVTLAREKRHKRKLEARGITEFLKYSNALTLTKQLKPYYDEALRKQQTGLCFIIAPRGTSLVDLELDDHVPLRLSDLICNPANTARDQYPYDETIKTALADLALKINSPNKQVVGVAFIRPLAKFKSNMGDIIISGTGDEILDPETIAVLNNIYDSDFRDANFDWFTPGFVALAGCHGVCFYNQDIRSRAKIKSEWGRKSITNPKQLLAQPVAWSEIKPY